MNELERIALNEILRTVTYIAETLEEIKDNLPPNDSQDLVRQGIEVASQCNE